MSFELLQKFQTAAYGRLWSGRAGARLAAALGGPMRPPQNKRKAVPLKLADLVPPAFVNFWADGTPRTWGDSLGQPDPEVQAQREWSQGEDYPDDWRPAKPHSIRAHDRTWSLEHGFHPHLHCLLFLHKEVDEQFLAGLLRDRWEDCLEITLENFNKLIARVLTGDLETKPPPALLARWNELDETDRALVEASWRKELVEKLRSRCEKTFGAKMFPKGETLVASAERVRAMLVPFRIGKLMPDRARGVVVEQVRKAGRVPRYLAKLGCELSGMLSKLGRVGDDGIEHYGMWQLANIAADKDHRLNAQARGAWKELYRATKGTQTLTWSQEARKALGVDGARDEEITQEEPGPHEETRMLGQIDGLVWDGLALKAKHRLVARIYELHHRGEITKLEDLGIMSSEGLELATVPRAIEPDEPEAPQPTFWQRWDSERAALARAKPPPQPREKWKGCTPEEKEEGLHQAHDMLEGLGLLVGGSRPRRRAASCSMAEDEATETVPQSEADGQAAIAEYLRRFDAGDVAPAPEQLWPLQWIVELQKRNADPGGARTGAASETPITARKESRASVLPGLAPFVKTVNRT